MNQLGITLGILLSYIIGDQLNWRWSAISGVFPAAVMSLCMVFMPETARWLVAHKKVSCSVTFLVSTNDSKFVLFQYSIDSGYTPPPPPPRIYVHLHVNKTNSVISTSDRSPSLIYPVLPEPIRPANTFLSFNRCHNPAAMYHYHINHLPIVVFSCIILIN